MDNVTATTASKPTSAATASQPICAETTAHELVRAAATVRKPARAAIVARDRAHAAADARAQVMGWTATPVAGVLGLAGRAYRDPRFDTARRPA
jgi:hypothetical protein